MENIKTVKEIIVKTFDVFDKTDGCSLIENLKTFEEAEDYIIAHDKRLHADWMLEFYRKPDKVNEFRHHEYIIDHTAGKIITYDSNLANMSFEELCDAAFGWRAISVVEFKF